MIEKLNRFTQNAFLILMIIMSIAVFILPLQSIYELSRRMTFGIIVAYVLLILIVYIIIKKIKLENKYVEIISVILIISLGLALRIGTDQIMKSVPISDFATPHAVYHLKDTGIFAKRNSVADNSFYQTYYSTFPAWYPYMQVVSVIYNIFGENIINIKILNWILFTLTSIALYFACKNSFSKRTGIFAILLFTLFPSHIIYSNITTPDHLSIFLITLWLLTWSKIVYYRKNEKKKEIIIFSVLNILCVCLINLFKPLSIFGILVFICAEILCFTDVLIEKETRKKYLKSGLIYCLSFILICFLALNIENKILYKVVEKKINTKVVDATSLYLLWGYSIDEKKQYNSKPANDIYDYILAKNNNDVEKSIEEVKSIAKDQFINNLPYLPSILWQKFFVAYYNEYDLFTIANHSNDAIYDQKISDNYLKIYNYIANGYMSMLLFLIIVALIKELRSKKRNSMIFISSLIIIGYTCILVFGGVQPRYKALIFGPICFLAASSLELRKREKEC